MKSQVKNVFYWVTKKLGNIWIIFFFFFSRKPFLIFFFFFFLFLLFFSVLFCNEKNDFTFGVFCIPRRRCRIRKPITSILRSWTCRGPRHPLILGYPDPLVIHQDRTSTRHRFRYADHSTLLPLPLLGVLLSVGSDCHVCWTISYMPSRDSCRAYH